MHLNPHAGRMTETQEWWCSDCGHAERTWSLEVPYRWRRAPELPEAPWRDEHPVSLARLPFPVLCGECAERWDEDPGAARATFVGGGTRAERWARHGVRLVGATREAPPRLPANLLG